MKKIAINSLLALSLLASTFLSPSHSVLASELESAKNISQTQDIQPFMTLTDIVMSYSSYQGPTVSHNYTERKSNGDVYYYTGTLKYIGRANGWYGSYKYLGDKTEFTLYKIVTKDGHSITPTSLPGILS